MAQSQVEVSLSAKIRDAQKDANPAGEISFTLTDATVPDYDAAKKCLIGPGLTKTIDVSHLGSVRFVGILAEGNKGYIQCFFKKTTGENNAVEIVEVFFAEMRSVEQIRLTNKGAEDVYVRVFLVGGP